MNPCHHLIDTIESLRTRPRTVGSIAIIVVVLFSMAQWRSSATDTTMVDPVLRTASAAPGTPAFDYFPSAYVNQATQREEHIEAF